MVLLHRPFVKFDGSAFAVVAPDYQFGDLADTAADRTWSNIQLFEDSKPIGPPHSSHFEISNKGQGRFSHEVHRVFNADAGFVFSSSDNSDPNTNGRNYWAVAPKEAPRDSVRKTAPPIPDTAPPTPVAAPPTPDVVPPATDAVPPAPDAVPPASDAAPSTSDAALPTPETAPPAPEAVPPATEAVPVASDEEVDPMPNGKLVIKLQRPFEVFDGMKMAVVHYLDVLAVLADKPGNLNRSPIVLYENGRALGPAHSNHGDIARLGEGRYSHWKSQGMVFSSSDNTNPNTNGRQYWAVLPEGTLDRTDLLPSKGKSVKSPPPVRKRKRNR